MLFLNNVLDSNILLFSYMFIYNISLIAFFWLLSSIINSNLKTLHSFSGFSLNSFHLFSITSLLFSMAGVPPFVGFFSKLFILVLITNSNFFLLYFLLFIVLLLGLYFYVQNIKFLHTTNSSDLEYVNIPLIGERNVVLFYYFLISVLLFLLLGFSFLDDIILIFTWLYS